METTKSHEAEASFEEIRAILRETARRQEESARRHEEIDLIVKNVARRQEELECLLQDQAAKREAERREEEVKREAERREEAKREAAREEKSARLSEELKRQMKETDRRLGKLGNRLGEIVEYMVMPNLQDKFEEFGFFFIKAYPHAAIQDEKNQIITEVDITLENEDTVMFVEVKLKPTIDDIKEHLERMEKMRRHGNLNADTRKYLGAMAGMVFNENERAFALKNGFYVVEPSGETFMIIPPEGSARQW